MILKLNKEQAKMLGLKEGQKIKLIEYWNKLTDGYGIPVFDTEHAIEQFRARHPDLSMNTYLKVLNKGLKKIQDKHNNDPDNRYVIISRKTDIKIPLELRYDRKIKDKLIFVTPTTLHTKENPMNKYGEISVLVEKCRKNNEYIIEHLFEGESSFLFQDIIENCGYTQTYEEIEVD